MNLSELEPPKGHAVPIGIEGSWRPEPHRWVWRARVSTTEPTALLLLGLYPHSIAWAKSSPAESPDLGLALALHPLASPAEIQVMFWAQPFAMLQGLSSHISEPSDRPYIPTSITSTTGRYVALVHFGGTPDLQIGLLAYTKQDLKVRRNHVWGLKESLLVGMSPAARAILHHGRYGTVIVGHAPDTPTPKSTTGAGA